MPRPAWICERRYPLHRIHLQSAAKRPRKRQVEEASVPRRLPPQAGEARLADAVHALIAAWSFDLEPKADKVLKHGFKITWPKDMQVGMNFK